MRIACISASNTRLSEVESTSVKVCNKVKEMIQKEIQEELSVEIIPLRDYNLKPCILCGSCYKSGCCIYDYEFNKLLKKLEESQGILFVVPHYSPIPVKLMMIFEKINEISYAGWINDPNYQSPFDHMPVAIIGHGGMVESEENLKYYHDHLVSPIANTLKALSFQIIKLNDQYPNGVAFGLKDDNCLRKSEITIFPDIIQDWEMIEERIKPLVISLVQHVREKTL